MYKLIWLNDRLVFIKLDASISKVSTRNLVRDLHKLLNQSTILIYILADLRHGHIVDTQIFNRIRFLTGHRNWAGSAAFRRNPISDLTNTKFQLLNLLPHDRDVIFNIPEEAIAYLELLEPGLTDEIMWDKVLQI